MPPLRNRAPLEFFDQWKNTPEALRSWSPSLKKGFYMDPKKHRRYLPCVPNIAPLLESWFPFGMASSQVVFFISGTVLFAFNLTSICLFILFGRWKKSQQYSPKNGG